MDDVFGILKYFRFRIPFCACLALTLGTGCAHLPRVAKTSETHSLCAALTSLDPSVNAREAEKVAECAYNYSRVLADRYRVVRPPLFHNFLVNSGFKQRGLCYEWAEDLLAQFRTLHFESLQLRWGIARANTSREHNCIVITAVGHPFKSGIVLDAWRHSGRLSWSPVAIDKYPWVEGQLDPSPPVPTQ